MKNANQKSTLLLTQDNPAIDDLYKMKNILEEMLITCSNVDFQGKDTLEYHTLDILIELCGSIGDIEGQVDYLNRLKDHSIRSEKYNNIDESIEFIKHDYGPLRIRFKGEEVINEMASLKTAEGKEVTINILAPTNAWLTDDPLDREKKKRRLNFIKEQSLRGKIKVFFDSYDSEEDYFYFELPYVPHLGKVESSEDWYAITFDKRKRYRTNFSPPTPRDPTPPLMIQPEDNWVLEISTPEKWVKVSFPNLKYKLKFLNRLTGIKLSESEYIRIQRRNSVDYYLPSDKKIDIIIPDRGQDIWNYFNIILNASLIVTLIYFIYIGVS